MRFTSLPHHRARLQQASAFTLVEMIVVISIIATLMTIGSFGLKNVTKASGVGMGVPIAEGVFAQARSLAIEKGTDARVLIRNESGNHEKHLRYMQVVYKDDATGKWIATTRGTYLPEGVYFSRNYSLKANSNFINKIPAVTAAERNIFGDPDDLTPNTNLTAPHFYYEFNSQGVIGFRNSVAPFEFVSASGATFVVGSGMKPPGANKPKVSGEAVKNFGGFVIWKQGQTSTFKHTDQIGPNENLNSISVGDEF